MRNDHPSHRALDRRRFVKAGSLLGLGSLFLPRTLLARPAEAGGGCDPTTDDILGPYYLPGSPVTTQVASLTEPGTRLFISGTVLSSDCVTPVPGAMPPGTRWPREPTCACSPWTGAA